MTKVEFKNVSKVYGGGDSATLAIQDFTLKVEEGKFTTIVGPSGCGKSSLLSLVAGFQKPTSGDVLIDGKTVQSPGPDRGFVFQDHALFPWKTVRGNIMFGLKANGCSRQEAARVAQEYIDLVQLKGFEDSYPLNLSGGMKQRVGLARALAYQPDILLMDEPFGALDAQTKKMMQRELVRIWSQFNKTVLFVTHSVIEATFISDVIVVMSARPGTVRAVIDVDLPRPRSYVDEGYLRVREDVLRYIEDEVKNASQV